ncbi:MAG: BatD family protein [Proteobacteria bacterium]|nr:BatD family protein [Pseudomonadota bacterium]
MHSPTSNVPVKKYCQFMLSDWPKTVLILTDLFYGLSKTFSHKFLFVFLSMMSIFSVQAPVLIAGSITAELDQNEIPLGDSVRLIVSVSGSLDGDLPVPEIDGLEIHSTGTSTNVQIINGKFSKEIGYNFQIVPTKIGSFSIPSFKVKIDGVEAATLPLTLNVTQSSSGGRQLPSRNGNVPGGPAGSDPSDSSADGPPSDAPVFVERTLKKSELFEGEAVLSSVKIFQRTRILQLVPDRQSAPDWRVISTEGQKTYDVERGGGMWRVTELKEVLIPLKSGELDLPSFSINVTYLEASKRRQRSGTIWDFLQQGMFDSGREVSKKLSSQKLKIKIKPIPSEGRPSVVSDMVGQFSVQIDVSKRELMIGDTSTVSVKIAGQGALDRMTKLSLPPYVSAKVYDDKPELKEIVNETGLSSTRTIKFAVVPSKSGVLELGVIELGIFDPISSKWNHVKESLGTIKVVDSNGNASQANVGRVDSGPTTLNGSVPEVNSSTSADSNDSSSAKVQPDSQTLDLKSENALKSNSWRKDTWLVWASVISVGMILFLAGYGFWSGSLAKKFTRTDRPFAVLERFADEGLKESDGGYQKLISQLKMILAPKSSAPDSLTSSDVERILKEWGVEANVIQDVIKPLQAIEASLYRDHIPTAEDLQDFKKSCIRLSKEVVSYVSQP